MMLNQSYQTHKLNKDPQTLIKEFINEIHSVIKNKFDKDIIRDFSY